MIRATAYIIVITMVTGCPCLPVPTSDATPPRASLRIDYMDTNNTKKTIEISAMSVDVTVTARKDRAIEVIYTGADNEGLRSVELIYDMIRRTGTTIVRPLLAEKKKTSKCPVKSLLGAESFHPGGQPWEYSFAAQSENWLGGLKTSAKVTIKTQ